MTKRNIPISLMGFDELLIKTYGRSPEYRKQKRISKVWSKLSARKRRRRKRGDWTWDYPEFNIAKDIGDEN